MLDGMKSLLDTETPSLLVDLNRLNKNIHRLQELANSHKVNLRPHIKTHKCLKIARLQLNAGAVGITASKTDEALVFINGGVRPVTLAYPMVVDTKIDRLLKASRFHNVDLRLVVDSVEGMEALSGAARRHGTQIKAFLKIDVGLHRCGVEEGDPLLVKLAREMDRNPSLNLLGLLSHAGHVYGAKSLTEAQSIAREECGIMTRIRHELQKEGIQVSEVSVGSTPTVLVSDCYDGITEIRPGNYVFMDRTPLRMGLIEPDRIAFSVMATVVSSNTDYFIIDAGSKVLSSDVGAHGIPGADGYGLGYPLDMFQEEKREMVLVKLSEEHGFLARRGFDLPIGSKVRIIPNHACSVANLADSYIIIEDDRPVDQWQVDARGRVQ
jgi:D-serine deaminase-like pyridoxal phosphate-dependent protein